MKKKIENLSMQTQLTVVILSVIVLAFGIILYSGYSGQARSFAEEYTSSTQTILEKILKYPDLILPVEAMTNMNIWRPRIQKMCFSGIITT